jgi:hypothetical protein
MPILDETDRRRGTCPIYARHLSKTAIGFAEHADAIAMLPGWETSRGARAEHALAQAIDGMRFIYLYGVCFYKVAIGDAT